MRHEPIEQWDKFRVGGPAKRENIKGLRSGKLTAEEPVARSRFGSIMWRCVCDCGGHSIVAATALKAGAVRACGCGRGKKRL